MGTRTTSSKVLLGALVSWLCGCAGTLNHNDQRAHDGTGTPGARKHGGPDANAKANANDDDPWAPRSDSPDYPVWPTAVTRATAPLLDPKENRESRLLEALAELEQLPLPLVERALAKSIDAKSVKVRRAAITQCLDRDASACIPVATARLEVEEDTALVSLLLTLVARQPGSEQIDALIAAAYSSDEPRRKHAVTLLGQSPPLVDRHQAITSTLVAKLGDGVAGVRAEAARSLGLVGARDSALALVRLLDDPDPYVRGAAAESLGRLGDPRTANALGRALPRAGAAEIASAMIEAIALIEGETADNLALAAFDDPPRHLSRSAVVAAIALRPEPSDAFVEGLIRRLRDPAVRSDALEVLLGIGAPAVPHLRAALDRGLEPALTLEVQRLLASLDPIPDPSGAGGEPGAGAGAGASHTEPSLVLAELRAVVANRRGSARDEAAISLGRWSALIDSAELRAQAAAITASGIERAPSAVAARPWLLAALSGVALDEGQPGSATAPSLLWSKLQQWSRDPESPAAERCFATVVLATGPRHGRPARDIDTSLRSLLSDGAAEVRSCATLSLIHREARRASAQTGPRREGRRALERVAQGALQDDSADVRAHAALALAGTGPHGPRIHAHLRRLAERDSHAHVQAAARLALASVAHDPAHDPAHHPGWLVPLQRDDRRERPGWSRMPMRAAAVASGSPVTVWFPAPGGGDIVLGFEAPSWRLHGEDPYDSALLEGVLDEDTIYIADDIF